MRAYSKDLRLRVLDAVGRGTPRAEAARLFQVSVPTIKRWLRRRRETGTVVPARRPGRPAVKMGPLRVGLLPQLEARPHATLEEHCQEWERTQQERVSRATMSRVIVGHFGWTRKKSR